MGYKIKISPIAKENIKDAIFYYKTNVSLKVAINFLKDYEQTLDKITINPFYRVYYKNFRGIPLKKYPYIIFFRIDENKKQILINAVFHTNQDTGKRP